MSRSKPIQELELAVLEFLQLRGNATATEIANSVGTTSVRARRILDSLLEQGLLHRHIHINAYPMGYFEVDILVKLKRNSQALLEKIIQWCIDDTRDSFLCETGGDQDLKIGVMVKTLLDVHQFIENLCETFDHPFSNKQLLPIIQLVHFGTPRTDDNPDQPTIRLGFTDHSFEPSKMDHELLRLLSREPSLCGEQLARRLATPASTLAYRMRRLEDVGVIAGYSYLFDPYGKMFEHFHAKVSIGGATKAARKALHTWCARNTNVLLYAEVQGEIDFFVGMITNRAMGAIEASRALHQALEPFNPHIEIYPCPTLRKLRKYPF